MLDWSFLARSQGCQSKRLMLSEVFQTLGDVVFSWGKSDSGDHVGVYPE